jgi:hypothetical protein
VAPSRHSGLNSLSPNEPKSSLTRISAFSGTSMNLISPNNSLTFVPHSCSCLLCNLDTCHVKMDGYCSRLKIPTLQMHSDFSRRRKPWHHVGLVRWRSSIEKLTVLVLPLQYKRYLENFSTKSDLERAELTHALHQATRPELDRLPSQGRIFNKPTITMVGDIHLLVVTVLHWILLKCLVGDTLQVVH